MSFVVIIPARYASTRLPGKPLVDINGKPMIVHVLERARESGADRVIVATDHPDVAQAVEAAGGEVCMTRADHQSGTERLAEVVEKCGFSDDTVIVNVQGDEPMIPAVIIRQVAENLAQRQVGMATLAVPIHHAEEALATAAVCLMSGHHDCPTVITVNADKLENCLMSLTLSIQSLQKHAMLEKA